MHSHRCSSLFAAATLALVFAGTTVHAAQPVAAKPAKTSGRAVEYVELEHQVGAVIVVETTLNTTRRGVLVKYTNPTLTLQLGPEAGSIQLSVPRDSIRRITLVEPAQAKAAPQEAGSAQTN